MHSGIDRRHATADDHHVASDGQVGLVGGLAQLCDEIDGIADIATIFAFGAQGIDARQADAKEHGIERRPQRVQRQIAAQRATGFHGDPADCQKPGHLLLSEIIRGLVGRNAIFVQAAGFGAGIIKRDRMTMHRQAVRGGKAGRPGPHDRNALAGRGAAGEGMPALPHQGIGGKALKAADFHRLAFGGFAHAGFFAQLFCRADAGAHAAQDVLLKDRARRRLGRARGDLADEERNVDGGGTGRDAGRIMAEIAAVGGDMRLMPVKGRLFVGELAAIAGGGQAPRHHAGRKRAVGQGGPPMAMAVFRKAATGSFFYQTVNFRQARTPCLCPEFGHCPP